MNETDGKPLIRGFLFACTQKTQAECFERSLFGTDAVYAPIVIRIRKGDLLFLNNLDTNTLYGAFRAISNGNVTTQPDAWDGKYPYQVKEVLGEKIALKKARRRLSKFEITRNTLIIGKDLIDFMN